MLKVQREVSIALAILERLTGKHSGKIETILSDLAAAQADIESLESSLESSNTNISSLQSAITSVSTNLTSLQNDLNSLESIVQGLESPSGLRKDSGTESGGTVTIDDAEICIVTTGGTAIPAGETYEITLTSNLITADSGFSCSLGNGTNTHGLPEIQSVYVTGTGEARIKILNQTAQKDSADTDGTLILTILILN